MISVPMEVSVALGLLAPVISLAGGTAAIARVGMKPVLGNREAPLELAGWVGRASRAFSNLLENLVPFAIVAFALQAAGLSSGLSDAAALAFLIARIGNALAYILGIQGLRTLLYNAGVAATFVTAAPLLSAL